MRSLFAVCVFVLALSAEAKVVFRCDHSDAMYALGEKAKITISVLDAQDAAVTSGCVSVRLDDFGRQACLEETRDLSRGNPFTVEGALDRPGFLRATVKELGKGNTQVWSVGFSPEKIERVTPEPADFDSFWAETRKRLAREVPLDPRMTALPEHSTDKFDFYRLSFATFGRRVHGIMTVPKDRTRRHPVRFHVPAAGFAPHTWGHFHGSPDEVMLRLWVFPFEIPLDGVGMKEKYDAMNAELAAKYGTDYARAGIGVSREDYFFYPVIAGIDRALDWIAAQPFVDDSDFSYEGTSQGGGFGLILCGLNRHLTRACFCVPALTDTLACLAGRQSGWPSPVELQKTPEAQANARRFAPYFDGAVFASRITCPVRLCLGLADTCCPPHCTWAAFNSIGSKDKKVFYGIGQGHGARTEFYEAWRVWQRAAAWPRRPLDIALTFDDNSKEFITTVAPELEKRGWRGTFNLIGGRLAEEGSAEARIRLTWKDAQELERRGHEVANHSLTHPNFIQQLNEGATNRVLREIVESRDLFARQLGHAPKRFCYPGHARNAETDKMVRDAGMEIESSGRPNYGLNTPPATETGAYVDLLRRIWRGERRLDMMIHGVNGRDGWWAFRSRDEFIRHLNDLQLLEREGLIRILLPPAERNRRQDG